MPQTADDVSKGGYSFVINDAGLNNAPSVAPQFMIKWGSGDVGIGTTNPAAKLDVAGTTQMTGFKLPTGAGASKVLSSDAAGVGTWNTLTSLIGANSITNAMIQSVDWSKITNAPSGSGSGWNLTGNAGTTASNFIGTIDNTPFVIKVNNDEMMRFGTEGNVSIGRNNTASGYGNTVAGGSFNVASNGKSATVGGGISNQASYEYATIAGGLGNVASGSAATVGGGSSNTAYGTNATVAGGVANVAQAAYSTVGGGFNNIASGNYATVAGGRENEAGGEGSFAAGMFAHANYKGSFVWNDGSGGNMNTQANYEFLIRASGGVTILSNAAATTGVKLAPGGGAWSSASDRNLKTNFQTVNTLDVLEKLVAIPLTTWNYKANTDIRHMGVMAQDFYAAFGGLGLDDKHIDTVDADGVAFAAIQGLNRKLQAQIEAQQKENTELRARLDRLESLLLKSLNR